MGDQSSGLILGISIGVVIGVVVAILALYCVRYQRKRAQIDNSSSRRSATIPIRANGVDACTELSDSTAGADSPRQFRKNINGMALWFDGFRKSNVVSASGILEFAYRDLQKATQNFTTLIGQGAFGPVYRAQMLTGEIVAVKVLATDSKQGEREFETEVKLLGRLHHRNLLNLIGYCTEKGKNMLIYVYMSNGSLASHLYNEKMEPLSWERRVHVALDVARGLEYLHDGAVPPVLHRDIKSSNILLDQSMRARVADFGLSREEVVDEQASKLKGTFGYLDPEYISTRTFTKKSDVYGYGVLLFELIAARNPLQGLMEYAELAAMNTEGGTGWEEIVDSRLDGNFDVWELNEVATLAYKCVNRVPKKRPSMRDIVQVLSRILKSRHTRKPKGTSLSATPEEVAIEVDQVESRASESGHRREESIDSMDTDL
ncbi:calcium/calmodulin-regulated receptor-like kinase 1 [Beta vulgaris subsp. vulgaris]|uniref:calcium/calmodulin-regulated receptor-like kinase 1 n=1 Tax=Beta vulgaris subsp. vulgaris TaxID=3555 RepID=UPI002036CCCB|nr:calcium/calmodulin-regulated receptor-like kinase 1 [Beta vulgaris subsp. vulgaris]XP_010694280.2 calcium/calmodulin-regulated receptor-like kinase 1 [Beta vulgaris subsp. vulgaris]XP_010694281.2 calcium/calmodulin-regulated receptor-like kinase 1 [Beta vulgaris subsp. vulgaris]XP_010694282.2 calcium/calmodulin-regulated receptor-like kinase 1 [Beta vulgaris subsp. vulgaris]XP_057249892.1 calcium/calmodulin-regulated receptor-like kinase 1 [Beta vulgaris subsp. vulgaris]